MAQRRRHSAEFKAKVALEVLRRLSSRVRPAVGKNYCRAPAETGALIQASRGKLFMVGRPLKNPAGMRS